MYINDNNSSYSSNSSEDNNNDLSINIFILQIIKIKMII